MSRYPARGRTSSVPRPVRFQKDPCEIVIRGPARRFLERDIVLVVKRSLIVAAQIPFDKSAHIIGVRDIFFEPTYLNVDERERRQEVAPQKGNARKLVICSRVYRLYGDGAGEKIFRRIDIVVVRTAQ